MKNILFFATYPIGDKIIDGMAQRIHSIDEEFDRWHRTYIEIGLKTFIKKEHEVLDDGRIDIYRVNLFLHVIFLYHIIKKHSHIYIHSLHLLKHPPTLCSPILVLIIVHSLYYQKVIDSLIFRHH